MFDLILKGGWVIDGSGGPPFRADVGAARNDDRRRRPARRCRGAARRSTSTGRYVVPGFIDAHVHGDLMLLADPIHLPALRQGVTTYLIGQDGSSFAPASPATLDYMRRYTAGFNGNPPGLSLRLADGRRVPRPLRPARGDQRRLPDPQRQRPDGGHGARSAARRRDDELRAMQKLVREGMDAGAVGLSTGLDYIPSRYADAREIAALCEAIVAENGVYVTHMRGYGPQRRRRDARGLRDRPGDRRAGSHLALQRAGRPAASADRPGPCARGST